MKEGVIKIIPSGDGGVGKGETGLHDTKGFLTVLLVFR